VRPCVIDWFDRVERAEAELRRVVIITLINASVAISLEDAAEVIATKLNIDRDSLVLRRTSHGKFLLFAEDEAGAISLTSRTPATGDSSIRVHCRRRTRQAFASGAVFPSLLEVELCGIPEHTWEVSTAENMLNPFGWIEEIHPSTRNREDYSSLRCSAWCFSPEEIPSERDLIVVEPRVAIVENPPVKRGLVYPVRIVVHPTNVSAPSSPEEDDSDHPRRRQRRRAQHSSDDVQPMPPPSPTCQRALETPPSRDRVEPSASNMSHAPAVVEAGDSSSGSMVAGLLCTDEQAIVSGGPQIEAEVPLATHRSPMTPSGCDRVEPTASSVGHVSAVVEAGASSSGSLAAGVLRIDEHAVMSLVAETEVSPASPVPSTIDSEAALDVTTSMFSPTLMSFNVAASPICAIEEHVSPLPSVMSVSSEEHVSPLPSVGLASMSVSPPVQDEAVPATQDPTSPIAPVSLDRNDAVPLMQSAEC
jgi:hypothetical protein